MEGQARSKIMQHGVIEYKKTTWPWRVLESGELQVFIKKESKWVEVINFNLHDVIN